MGVAQDNLRRNKIMREEKKNPGQRIIVFSGADSRARISFQERDATGWQIRRSSGGWIGYNGLGKKKEGDGRTPVGRFSFLYAFGTCPNPGTAFPYRRIDESHELVDDMHSRYYNQIVSRRDVPVDWRSAEHMAAMGQAYHYGIVTDYNRERIPGLGSGIFLHCGEGHPTGGCISVPQEMMRFLLQNMSPDCYMVIDFPGGKCYTYG